jgi:hypothetical protein
VLTVPRLYISADWGEGFVSHQPVINLPPAVERLGAIKLDDPTIWTDENDFWHILSHNGDGPAPCGDNTAVGLAFRDGNPLPVGCSAHLFSRDGLNWTMSGVDAAISASSIDPSVTNPCLASPG